MQHETKIEHYVASGWRKRSEKKNLKKTRLQAEAGLVLRERKRT